MKGLLMCAPTIGVLFIFSGVAFGAFGDVVSYYEIGLDYGMYQPISLCCNDGKIWILEARAREYEEDQYCLTIYQFKLMTTNGQNLKFERSFNIYFYGRGDMNGFCYVTENSNKYIWTTITTYRKLIQLDMTSTYTPLTDDGLVGIRTKRYLTLPENYYPTGVTLDIMLNIYFLDGKTRKVYRINYSYYSDITVGDVDPAYITELFEVPRSPSIPMGIEYVSGIPGKFYFTLAGEHDYLIKTNMSGFLLDSLELSDPEDPENTISYMPSDLTIDGQGYIWFTDDDWDILYKVEGSSQ